MNIQLSDLFNPLRAVKRKLFADRLDYHTIKFGIAAGMQMPINRHCNLRLELGLYEIGIARYFARLSQGVQVGYDIGSAWGYYVLAMRRQGVTSIYAFEPDHRRILSLRETLSRNGIANGVQILDCFVGERTEESVCSIDDLVTTGRIRPPGLVKMDIDGAEVQALLGMKRIVHAWHPAFIVEIHSVTLEENCIRFLQAADYDQIHIVDNGFIIDRFMPEGRPIELNRWVVAWCSAHANRKLAGKQ